MMPSVLVGAAWAAEDKDDPHSITGTKYSFTGAGDAWAAPREDDTTSGISLTIGGTGKSTIRSSKKCSGKSFRGITCTFSKSCSWICGAKSAL